MRRFLAADGTALACKLFDGFRVKAIAVAGLLLILAAGCLGQSAFAQGAWVDSLTGRAVPTLPAGGAEPDLTDRNHAFNPRTGQNYHWDPKYACPPPKASVLLESVQPRIGNNPFNPQNPLGVPVAGTTPQTSGCTTPQPANVTQQLACPAGTGSITQTQTYSCVGTTWTPGPFQTTSNTCTGPQGCIPPQPASVTQQVSCPVGQMGSITQTQTYSCVGNAWVLGSPVQTSSTCTPQPTGCATNFSSGNYVCSGSCGISSTGLTVVSGSNTMTAGTFGSNTNVGFNCAGPTASSQNTNLIILGLPGHRCTLNGLALNSFSALCQNNSGGSCTSSCSR
jgi:hypothetical protein